MVVDHDLMRDILLELEKLPASAAPINVRQWQEYTREGKTKEEISEHVRLMGEAGWVETHKNAQQTGIYWYPVRITWAGHQHLAGIRSETVYAKTKEIARQTFGTVTVETIKAAIPVALQVMLKAQGYLS